VKRHYETLVLFDGTLPDESIAKEQSLFEKMLTENGTFEKTDVWGKRTMAYAIRKKKSGFYSLFLYEAESDMPEKIERFFKLNTAVLRQMTLVRDLDKAYKLAALPLDAVTDPGDDSSSDEGDMRE
jgi:small subunit ribosomal protein S6